MDFLCSKFRQINNNVVTVKNYVARTKTVSYMRFFPVIAQGMKEVIIHLNQYQMRALIPVTRWVMIMHMKHQIWKT